MCTFRTGRDVPATPESVFAAFEEPARLARLWGPAGFTNTSHTFEFREGGVWDFTMHGLDGKDYPNQSEFLEIVPGERIRIKHVNLPHFDLTNTLEAIPDGTRLSWAGIFENREFAENAREFLETANEQNLDRLALEVGGIAQHGART